MSTTTFKNDKYSHNNSTTNNSNSPKPDKDSSDSSSAMSTNASFQPPQPQFQSSSSLSTSQLNRPTETSTKQHQQQQTSKKSHSSHNPTVSQALFSYSSQSTAWPFNSSRCSPQIFDSLSLERCRKDRSLIRFDSQPFSQPKSLIPPRPLHQDNSQTQNDSFYTTSAPSAVSPEMLIVYLTSRDILSYEVLSDFFLTYRLFMDPFELLEMIFARLAWAIQFHHACGNGSEQQQKNTHNLSTNRPSQQQQQQQQAASSSPKPSAGPSFLSPRYPVSSNVTPNLASFNRILPESSSGLSKSLDPKPSSNLEHFYPSTIIHELGRDVAVRTFVMLRHWVLNFFPEDFVCSYELRVQFAIYSNALYSWEPVQKNNSFLRILVQLKKSWISQCAIYWDTDSYTPQMAQREMQPLTLNQPEYPNQSNVHTQKKLPESENNNKNFKGVKPGGGYNSCAPSRTNSVVSLAPSTRRTTILSLYQTPIPAVLSSTDIALTKESKANTVLLNNKDADTKAPGNSAQSDNNKNNNNNSEKEKDKDSPEAINHQIIAMMGQLIRGTTAITPSSDIAVVFKQPPTPVMTVRPIQPDLKYPPLDPQLQHQQQDSPPQQADLNYQQKTPLLSSKSPSPQKTTSKSTDIPVSPILPSSTPGTLQTIPVPVPAPAQVPIPVPMPVPLPAATNPNDTVSKKKSRNTIKTVVDFWKRELGHNRNKGVSKFFSKIVAEDHEDVGKRKGRDSKPDLSLSEPGPFSSDPATLSESAQMGEAKAEEHDDDNDDGETPSTPKHNILPDQSVDSSRVRIDILSARVIEELENILEEAKNQDASAQDLSNSYIDNQTTQVDSNSVPSSYPIAATPSTTFTSNNESRLPESHYNNHKLNGSLSSLNSYNGQQSVLSRPSSQSSRVSLIDSLDMRTTISRLSPQRNVPLTSSNHGLSLRLGHSRKGKHSVNSSNATSTSSSIGNNNQFLTSKPLISPIKRNVSEPFLPLYFESESSTASSSLFVSSDLAVSSSSLVDSAATLSTNNNNTQWTTNSYSSDQAATPFNTLGPAFAVKKRTNDAPLFLNTDSAGLNSTNFSNVESIGSAFQSTSKFSPIVECDTPKLDSHSVKSDRQSFYRISTGSKLSTGSAGQSNTSSGDLRSVGASYRNSQETALPVVQPLNIIGGDISANTSIITNNYQPQKLHPNTPPLIVVQNENDNSNTFSSSSSHDLKYSKPLPIFSRTPLSSQKSRLSYASLSPSTPKIDSFESSAGSGSVRNSADDDDEEDHECTSYTSPTTVSVAGESLQNRDISLARQSINSLGIQMSLDNSQRLNPDISIAFGSSLYLNDSSTRESWKTALTNDVLSHHSFLLSDEDNHNNGDGNNSGNEAQGGDGLDPPESAIAMAFGSLKRLSFASFDSAETGSTINTKEQQLDPTTTTSTATEPTGAAVAGTTKTIKRRVPLQQQQQQKYAPSNTNKNVVGLGLGLQNAYSTLDSNNSFAEPSGHGQKQRVDEPKLCLDNTSTFGPKVEHKVSSSSLLSDSRQQQKQPAPKPKLSIQRSFDSFRMGRSLSRSRSRSFSNAQPGVGNLNLNSNSNGNSNTSNLPRFPDSDGIYSPVSMISAETVNFQEFTSQSLASPMSLDSDSSGLLFEESDSFSAVLDQQQQQHHQHQNREGMASHSLINKSSNSNFSLSSSSLGSSSIFAGPSNASNAFRTIEDKTSMSNLRRTNVNLAATMMASEDHQLGGSSTGTGTGSGGLRVTTRTNFRKRSQSFGSIGSSKGGGQSMAMHFNFGNDEERAFSSLSSPVSPSFSLGKSAFNHDDNNELFVAPLDNEVRLDEDLAIKPANDNTPPADSNDGLPLHKDTIAGSFSLSDPPLPPLLQTFTAGDNNTGQFSNDDLLSVPFSSSPTVKQNATFLKAHDATTHSGSCLSESVATASANSNASVSLDRSMEITDHMSSSGKPSSTGNTQTSALKLSNSNSSNNNGNGNGSGSGAGGNNTSVPKDDNLQLGLTAADIGLELTPEQQLVAQRQQIQKGRGLSFFGITGLGTNPDGENNVRNSVSTFSSFDSRNSVQPDVSSHGLGLANSHPLKRMGAACIARQQGSSKLGLSSSNYNDFSTTANANAQSSAAAAEGSDSTPAPNKNMLYPGLDSEIVAELACIPDDIPLGDATFAREAALRKLEGTYEQFEEEREQNMSPEELELEKEIEQQATVLEERIGEELEELERQQIQDIQRIKASESKEALALPTNKLAGVNTQHSSEFVKHGEPVCIGDGNQPEELLRGPSQTPKTLLGVSSSASSLPNNSSLQELALRVSSNHLLDEIVAPIMSAALETPPQSPIISPLNGPTENFVLRTPRPLLPRRYTDSNPIIFRSDRYEDDGKMRSLGMRLNNENTTTVTTLAVPAFATSFPKSAPATVTKFDIDSYPPLPPLNLPEKISSKSSESLNRSKSCSTALKLNGLAEQCAASQVEKRSSHSRIPAITNIQFCASSTPPQETSSSSISEGCHCSCHNPNTHRNGTKVDKKHLEEGQRHSTALRSSSTDVADNAGRCCSCGTDSISENNLSASQILADLSLISSPGEATSRVYNEAFTMPTKVLVDPTDADNKTSNLPTINVLSSLPDSSNLDKTVTINGNNSPSLLPEASIDPKRFLVPQKSSDNSKLLEPNKKGTDWRLKPSKSISDLFGYTKTEASTSSFAFRTKSNTTRPAINNSTSRNNLSGSKKAKDVSTDSQVSGSTHYELSNDEQNPGDSFDGYDRISGVWLGNFQGSSTPIHKTVESKHGNRSLSFKPFKYTAAPSTSASSGLTTSKGLASNSEGHSNRSVSGGSAWRIFGSGQTSGASAPSLSTTNAKGKRYISSGESKLEVGSGSNESVLRKSPLLPSHAIPAGRFKRDLGHETERTSSFAESSLKDIDITLSLQNNQSSNTPMELASEAQNTTFIESNRPSSQNFSKPTKDIARSSTTTTDRPKLQLQQQLPSYGHNRLPSIIVRTKRDPLSVDVSVSNGNHAPFILSCSSRVLAEQLTLIERDALAEVDWQELIDLGWNKSVNPIQSWLSFLIERPACQGTELVISRFNLVVNWVKSEILLTRALDERAATVARFIHIAYHSRRLQNFSTMMQIVLALSSFAIQRLNKTWAAISPQDQSMLLQLEGVVSPLRNFQKLRTEINSIDATKGCIPFLGVYLSDLTFNAERPAFVDATLPKSGEDSPFAFRRRRKPESLPLLSLSLSSSPSSSFSLSSQHKPSLSSSSYSSSSSSSSSPPNSKKRKLINFDRFRTSANIVKSLMQCIEWSSNYKFVPDHDILAKCLYIQSLTEEEMNACYQYLDESK